MWLDSRYLRRESKGQLLASWCGPP